MKRTRRPLDLRRAVGSALLLLLWVLGGPVPAGAAEPDPVQRAGLVIVQADGSPALHCVAFDGPEIDGLALLRQAGVQLTVSAGSAGTAICAIDDTGCPASDCFCACKAAPCRYWTYFHAAGDGGWVYSGRGAAGWSLRDGDVDAWVWGDSSAAPPDVTFVEICGGETEPPPGTTTPVLEIATPETTPDVTPQTPAPVPPLLSPPATDASDPAQPPVLNYILFVILVGAVGGGYLLVHGRR